MTFKAYSDGPIKNLHLSISVSFSTKNNTTYISHCPVLDNTTSMNGTSNNNKIDFERD